ncbi:MAG: ABC transporter permease [Balneola sp.]
MKPPKSAVRFLIFFLKQELQEEVLGDLEEQFHLNVKRGSLLKAKFKYWLQVLNYLRPFAVKNFSTPQIYTPMIKHNFKVSYRTLLKNKMYSLINIGGLAIGLTVSLFIGLWIHDEYSYNQNHEHYDQIVQVMRKDITPDQIYVNTSLTGGIGVELAEKYPNYFKHIAMTFFRSESQLLIKEENIYKEMGYFFQSDITHILTLEMVEGTREALQNPSNIIISESLAEKIFGNKRAIGETLSLNSDTELIVQGIYEDLPDNSTFGDAGFFASQALFYNEQNPYVWDNYNMRIYAQLQPNIDVSEASSVIKDLMVPYRDVDDDPRELFLLPMKDWYLNSEFANGVRVTSQQVEFIRLFGIIGIFILLIACINFMNLNTAQFQKRGKEVGVRKTMGSLRGQVASQFLMESFLYSIGAFIISLLLLYLFLPSFNDFAGKEIGFEWKNPLFWASGIGLSLLVAVLAGSYPAIFLSSFNPIEAIKGKLNKGGKSERFRQILVVFQFTISIVLIIGTITIHQQINYAKDRPVGYQQDRLVTLTGSSELYRNRDVLRMELINSGVIEDVAFANYPLNNTLGNNDGFRLPGAMNDLPVTFNTVFVSPEYGETTKWELVEGRSFSRERGDESSSIIVSESAVEGMGLDNPIGQEIIASSSFNGDRLTIIGVVKDMIKGSPFQKPVPLMLFSTTNPLRYMFIRIKPGIPLSNGIAEIRETFKEVVPSHPFEYDFADDQYLTKFRSEERIGTLATLFSGLAILISCLGLFGLSAFMVTQRIKEIGIRKVLGASIVNLWLLLSKDFGRLVVSACLIAIPISYYYIEKWLQNYEYHIPIYWWMFVIGIASCILVTMLTVSYHSIKASLANPVESLKSE